MFGKKTGIDSEKDLAGHSQAGDRSTINVQTIPADFYGGVNPVVKFKKVEKEIALGSKPKLTDSEKKIFDQSTAAGSGSILHPANIFTSKKYAWLVGSGLFIVILAGVGGYYYWQIKQQQTKIFSPPQPKISVTTSTESVPETVVATDQPVVSPTTTLPSLAEAPIEFPSSLLGDSPDLDKDNLTDATEELFGSDPSKSDTDEDTYNDGHEVFYLYNPVGKEPKKVIDSGYIKDYGNPLLGYKIFYPATWAVGNTDETYRDVLFSSITGENIEVRVFDKQPNQTFSDWFALYAPNERYQNLVDFQTRFGEKGKSRTDNLVYYFTDNNHVYVLVYHTTDSNTVNFRSVMVMIARSFRSAGFVPLENLTPPSQEANLPDEMPSAVVSSSLK
ncbi:MAG TPA: hypothetical protein VLK22_03850 [Candidatus Udaeobacter sp.]|nr:hypothetical protein [Candidatus Udaeobacter sp.]